MPEESLGALRAAARVAGKAEAAKAKSFDGPPSQKLAVSKFVCDVAARNHGSQRRHRMRHRIASRQGKSLRVLQRSTAVCAAAKNTKSLAARSG